MYNHKKLICVDENVYVKIQKPVVNKGLFQYQHKDLYGTGWDDGEKNIVYNGCVYKIVLMFYTRC